VSKLREAAKGQECMIRVPGVCSFNHEQTVLTHFRLGGLCGTGMKPPDLIGAWGCDPCHAAVDGRSKTAFSRDQLRFMHAEGVLRTIDKLLKLGKVKT
jgi:hypothetical protein